METVAPAPGADQGSGLRGGPVRFAGEGLRVDARERVVSSDQAVLLTQDHSQVQAQSGKKIATPHADGMLVDARRIMAVLGCS